jgi:release factor glutamine methyltransferase
VSLAQQLKQAAEAFEEAGIDSASTDAELLAAHVLKISRGQLALELAMGSAHLDEQQLEDFQNLIQRRLQREPLQHLTGQAHFRNISLKVGSGVFVPRPETEFVTGLAIDAIMADASPAPIVVDLCAGSGAIGLAIATELPHTRVFGVELSDDAIEYTRENYATIAPQNAQILHADMADAFHELDGTVDFVISNPPYIPAAMVPIYPEVALYDPEMALYGGEDGLDLVKTVSDVAWRLLRKGGGLAIEHADIQAEQVRQLLLSRGWTLIQSHQDLNQRDRAVTARR